MSHLRLSDLVDMVPVHNILRGRVPAIWADSDSIAVTLLPLPTSLLSAPSKWTTTLHGNITITLFLFIVRSAYFLGIGRHSPLPGHSQGSGKGERRKSHGQAGVPLPASRVPEVGKAAEGLVKAVEAVERGPIRRGKKA